MIGEPHHHSDAGALWRVLDVARRIAVPCQLEELLKLIIDVARQVLTADRGTVFLYDADKCELYSTVATGEKQIRLSVEVGIAGQCARTRKIINVPDCYADPRFNRDTDRQTGYRTRCSLTVPLVGLDDEMVGVTQLLNPNKSAFDAHDERMAAALASQAAVAIQRARLMEERMIKLKLERDLALARKIQMDVLPKELPQCPGYDLAAFSRPADQTGGDIYDLVALPPPTAAQGQSRSLLILLADATGHGIGPALSVMQVRAMLRIALRFSQRIDDLITHINRQLSEDLAATRFVTVFLGILDRVKHRLEYHAPGQGPLLHFRARQRCCQWHNASAIPLGILAESTFAPPPPIDLARGDLLVLLTDGFYECQNAKGDQLGHKRVGRVVADHATQSAQQILDAVVAAAMDFAQGTAQSDDLTAVVLKRIG